jgi:hypothetical protein
MVLLIWPLTSKPSALAAPSRAATGSGSGCDIGGCGEDFSADDGGEINGESGSGRSSDGGGGEGLCRGDFTLGEAGGGGSGGLHGGCFLKARLQELTRLSGFSVCVVNSNVIIRDLV